MMYPNVASSSKEKFETKLLLTELVRINKPLFQEIFADSGLDTSVSMTQTEAVSMQSLLQSNIYLLKITILGLPKSIKKWLTKFLLAYFS